MFETKTTAAGGTARKREVERLSVPFQIKADTANDDARTFQGLASTYALDLGGDIIHPGAYARTLAHWKAAGRVIPLIDLHGYDSVRRVVGKIVDAAETADGLLCTFQVIKADAGEQDADADAAWRRVKGGFVTGLSIGYRAVRFDWEQPEGTTSYYDRVRHLYELELREVSLVIWGMQPGALIDTGSAKSLVEALRSGALNDEEKNEIRALLDASPPAPADTTPTGLAPEDPKRLAMDEALRNLTIRGLAARA